VSQFPLEKVFTTLEGDSVFWIDRRVSPAFDMQLLADFPVYPNVLGKLQAISTDEVEKYQWFWFLEQTFPPEEFLFRHDQKNPKLRQARDDEFRYWVGRYPKTNLSASRCVKHIPRIPPWKHFVKEKKGGVARQSLVVQDSLADVGHSEFLTTRIEILNPVLKGPDVHGTHILSVVLKNKEFFNESSVHLVPIEVLPSGRIELKAVIEGLLRIEKLLQSEPLSQAPRILYLGYVFESLEAHAPVGKHPLFEVLRRVLDFDVAVVAPVGNRVTLAQGQRLSYPVDFPWPIQQTRGVFVPVGASDLCSQLAWFSKRPKQLSQFFTAPGERIYAAFPHEDYGFLSGTSQAAAQVASFLSVLSAQFPSYTMEQVVSRAYQGGLAIQDNPSKSIGYFINDFENRKNKSLAY
jgi:Subtilase family